jgi:hypothetical protein
MMPMPFGGGSRSGWHVGETVRLALRPQQVLSQSAQTPDSQGGIAPKLWHHRSLPVLKLRIRVVKLPKLLPIPEKLFLYIRRGNRCPGYGVEVATRVKLIEVA